MNLKPGPSARANMEKLKISYREMEIFILGIMLTYVRPNTWTRKQWKGEVIASYVAVELSGDLAQTRETEEC